MSSKKHSSKKSQEKEMIGKVLLVNKPKGLYRLYPSLNGHDYVLVELTKHEEKDEFIAKLFGSDVNGTQLEPVDVPHMSVKESGEFFKEIGYKLTHQ